MFFLFFQLNVFEFTDLEDLQIFLKRYIYLVSSVQWFIFVLKFGHNTVPDTWTL